MVGILTQKTHVIDSKQIRTVYTELYRSEFGLPFIFTEKSENEDADLTEGMIEYMRQYLLRGAEQSRKTSMHAESGLQNFAGWANNASVYIKAFTELAKGIISLFKTVKTTTLKAHIKGEGFKAYKAMSNYARILGVPTRDYKNFLKSYKGMVGIKGAPREKEIDAYFEIAEFASNMWKVNDFVFSVGGKDNICNNLVISNQIDYADNVIHMLSVKVNGSFELADDTLIYTQYKSVMAGLKETTKDIRKNLPRDIKDDEIKAINALMLLNAMNVYAENSGIKFNLPNNNPWKM